MCSHGESFTNIIGAIFVMVVVVGGIYYLIGYTICQVFYFWHDKKIQKIDGEIAMLNSYLSDVSRKYECEISQINQMFKKAGNIK